MTSSMDDPAWVEAERVKFEAGIARKHFLPLETCSTLGGGWEYIYPETKGYWRGWLASAATCQAEIATLSARVEELEAAAKNAQSVFAILLEPATSQTSAITAWAQCVVAELKLRKAIGGTNAG